LDGSIHTIKKNSETSVVASQEVSPECNAEKIQYMAMSGGQNAEQYLKMKGGNEPLKRWNNSDIWEQTEQIKIAFTIKLKDREMNE
jgi:hypothetical protein